MYIRDKEVDIAERRDQRKRDRKENKRTAKQQRIERQHQWAAEHRRVRAEAIAAKEERNRRAALEAKKKQQAARREKVAERRKEARQHLQPGYTGPSVTRPKPTVTPMSSSKQSDMSEAPPKRPRVQFDVLARESKRLAGGGADAQADQSSSPQSHAAEKYIPPALRRAHRGLDEAIRSACNKLTPHNIPSLTEEVTDLFITGKYPRAEVISSLAENIILNAVVQDTPVTDGVSLAYAGLLRGLQILHGNDVGAPIIEKVCMEVERQRNNRSTESPLKNGVMLLANLFVGCCVDCDLAVTFLHALLSEASSEADAAAAVTFVQAAGERLRKDAPLGLNQAVLLANRAATSSVAGPVSQRKSMLLSSIKILAAQRSKAKRGKKDGDDGTAFDSSALSISAEDAATAVSKGVCSLLSKRLGEGSNNARALQRAVVSTNVLSVKWSYIIRDDKPSRWYAQRLTSQASEEVAPKKRGRSSDEESDNSSDESEERAQEARREEISALRAEETALAGQRFPTEAKRQIFKCITGASDDLEAFQMIVMRDPSGSQFLDAAAVLLQCCQQEALFNMFYGRVLQRLVSAKKSFRQTLQFAIWDRFKFVRLDPVDVTSYVNLACLLTQLLEEGIYSLALFRGLDMDSVNKQLGFFCKILFSRMIAGLSAKALTMTFFGTDGFVAADLNADTNKIRRCVAQFFARYFLDEDECSKWLPHVYEVVCCGTPFADGQDTEGFLKRARVAYKALIGGVS
jgi:nucleolar MIF4G domain-containing protein 1